MDIPALLDSIHNQIFDPARLPVAVAAIVVVAVTGVLTGPLFGNANPLFWRSVDFLFGHARAADFALDQGKHVEQRLGTVADIAFAGRGVVRLAPEPGRIPERPRGAGGACDDIGLIDSLTITR